MLPDHAGTKYRPEIDGLRALAVVPVILFHAGIAGFEGGYVGVDVFFVISGYLITGILLGQCAAGTFSIADFYERRIRRILPALFFVMLVCLPLSWLWLLPTSMKEFMQSVATTPAFATNVWLFLKSGYFDTDAELKPLLHTWSLAVEEQYYVLFPLLVRLVWPLGLRAMAVMIAVLGVASLTTAQLTAESHSAFAYFLLPSRFWEILVGAGAALYLFGREAEVQAPKRKLLRELGAALGCFAIVYSIVAFDRWTPFPGVYALVPTLGALCIVLFATPATWAGKLLAHRFLVGVGLVSYSAYLWHQPLFAFARHRSLTAPTPVLLLGLSALSLVLAYVTWRFVEAPFRGRGRFTRKRIFLWAAVGSLAFMGLGALGHRTQGFPSRFDPQTLALLEVEADRVLRPQCDPKITGARSLEPLCDLGSEGENVGVLLGDSHGDALVTALDEGLRARGLHFKNGTWLGCPPTTNLRKATTDDPQCFEFNRAMLDGVRRSHTTQTVVMVARWTMWLDGVGENLDNTHAHGNGFDNGEGGVEMLVRTPTPPLRPGDATYEARRLFARSRHQDTVKAYLAAGKRVILIYPIPEMGWDVPHYLAKYIAFNGADSLTQDAGSIAHTAYRARNTEVTSTFDGIGEHPNLVRIRPDTLFCNTVVANRCVAHLDGNPLYFDDDHLSHHGANAIVAEVLKHVPPSD